MVCDVLPGLEEFYTALLYAGEHGQRHGAAPALAGGPPMTRMVTTLSLALFLALSSLAAAGGENCEKAAHAAKAKTAAHDKAKHGWLGLEMKKNAAGSHVVTGVVA